MQYEIDLSSFDGAMSYDTCLMNNLLESIDNDSVVITSKESVESTVDVNSSVNSLGNWLYDHVYAQVYYRLIDLPNYFDGIKLCM